MLGDFPRTLTASGVHVAGLDGVLRYWPKPTASAVVVGLTGSEIADLTDGGVPFATIYEDSSATWMAGGFGAGQTAARWLQKQFAATGYTPRCVYLTADSTTLSLDAVNACLDGAASVLGVGMLGLYGYLTQLQGAKAGNHASFYWLCGRYVPPSQYPWINLYQCQGSQPAQYATIVTVAGQVGDGDIAFTTDWGQNEMALTQADAVLVAQQVWAQSLTSIDGKNIALSAATWLVGSDQGAWAADADAQAAIKAAQTVDADLKSAASALQSALQAGGVTPDALSAAFNSAGLPAALAQQFLTVLEKAAQPPASA